MNRRSLAVLAVAAMGCSQATTRGTGTPAPQQTPNRASGAPSGAQQGAPAGGPAGATAVGGPGAQRPGGMKPFAELVKDAKMQHGFLDTYEKDGKVYLAVPRAELNRDLLLSFQIAQGIGSRGLFGGTMMSIFEPALVTLERRADQLYLVQKQPHYRATPGSATAQAVDLTFGSSVLDVAPIASIRPADSAVVIDATDWIVSDLSGIGDAMRFVVSPRPGQPGRAMLDKKRSYVEYAKAFPRNVNFRTKLTFTPAEPVNIQQVSDSRYIPVSIHYTLARLPDEPMTPRLADDRMGYFMTVHKNFSKQDESFFVRYVNRWRLECSDKVVDGLCVPKQPIVYYVDRTVPEEYRPALMDGVNRWARAFEAAGFKDAIHAELLPDSADAEDIRYHTLRWNVSDEPGYGAIGPSIVDPRTGEILDADILFEANMAQGFRWNWGVRTTAAQAVGALFAAPVDEQGNALPENAFLADAFAAQGGLLRAALAAKGELGPSDPVPMPIVRQAMTWVTMHEMGHTLGLYHNFRSSADTPLDRLQDREWTEKNGVFSSVMEYPSPNLAHGGQAQGLYYNEYPGSSDHWVISYGYTPDEAKAREIARQAAQPGHAFANDIDAYPPAGVDPTVTPFDLGADPLGWAKGRAQLIRTLIPTLPSRALADDERYARLTQGFQALLNQYVQAVAISAKYVGGQYQYRDHVGDPNGRPPFVNVPKAKQQEALDFLAEYGFGEKAFEYSPELLQKLGANRWAHWGENSTFQGRIDYPLAEQVAGAQRAMLSQVLQPMLFARIRDAELRYGQSQVLTTPEYLGRLTNAIWSEAGAGRNVASMRRELQRTWVGMMSDLAIGDVPRLPADARAVARAQLSTVKRRLDARLATGGMDEYTRAHFAESSARIGRALDAQMEAK